MRPVGTDWRLGGGRVLSLAEPAVMAILNLTPDSFSDGGQLATIDAVIAAVRDAVNAGAAMLDIGGESTRPGAARVSAPEQIARVIPAIRAIRASGGELATIPISIDTTRSPVAQAALDAGADAINDVSGGVEDPGILTLATERSAGLILMHRERPPDQDQYSTAYGGPSTPEPVRGDIVAHVGAALKSMLERAARAGVDPHAIVLDPGLGFGKSVRQNIELIVRTSALLGLGRPILSGVSRKSFTGAVSAPPGVTLTPAERLPGTLALSIEHLRAGARLFRVHDVAAHTQALRAAWACMGGDT